MRTALLAFCATIALAAGAADTDWKKADQEWRQRADASLRRDNGWLTLAGRYVLKPGVSTFGTDPACDVVFPAGLGPAQMGTVEVKDGKVLVKAAPGLALEKDGVTMADKVMSTSTENRDWVNVGPRASFHIISREGRYILRLADKESDVRKRFGGRVWYDLKDDFRVPAKYVPYDPPRTVPIVNVIDEVSDEPSPGYVEFKVGGEVHRLDAVGDDDGLFFVFRDATAGDTTYGSGRFLYIDRKPKPGEPFMFDLNRAYNPPCAFSEFTTCPLPPRQNILKVKIEAGEKYPPRRAG